MLSGVHNGPGFDRERPRDARLRRLPGRLFLVSRKRDFPAATGIRYRSFLTLNLLHMTIVVHDELPGV